MLVHNPEGGKSVMKFTVIWDNSLQGSGSGTNFPSGRLHGFLEIAQFQLQE